MTLYWLELDHVSALLELSLQAEVGGGAPEEEGSQAKCW